MLARDRHGRGFTLIELLVVLAIIATLLTIALPRYFRSIDSSKETVLKQNLAVMREAIDRHYSDTGKYPDTLPTLVEKRYLRAVPPDPMTESAETWVTVPPQNAALGGVADVHSGAPGKASDGSAYAEW